MKINWGTGIVIAFILFMSFILYFVLSVQTNSKYDNELVVEEYYKKDTHYEDEMKELRNTESLAQKPAITIDTEGIKVVFPENLNPKKITGKVSLYRPSNKKLDFEIPLSLSDPYLLVPKSNLVTGRWGITIEWKYDGKDYIIKDEIYFK
jgi:nitrogen fixation protein FixH